MMNKKGFTLIELLVVIAIIGILSGIVLASLGTARTKGQDAAIKSNLASARAQAELFYNDNGNSYDGGTAATDVCNTAGLAGTTKGIYSMVDAAGQAGGNAANSTITDAVQTGTFAVCQSNGNAWGAQAALKSTPNTWWCVDSTGASKQEAAVMPASANKCA
jgi:prepilin-type N-terminal cleavage/methylation domain-containing protein